MKFHDYFYTRYEATFFIAKGGEREKTPYPNPLFKKKKREEGNLGKGLLSVTSCVSLMVSFDVESCFLYVDKLMTGQPSTLTQYYDC